MINQLILACMMWFKNLRKTCACDLRVAASLPRSQTPSAELFKGGRREGDLNFFVTSRSHNLSSFVLVFDPFRSSSFQAS